MEEADTRWSLARAWMAARHLFSMKFVSLTSHACLLAMLKSSHRTPLSLANTRETRILKDPAI